MTINYNGLTWAIFFLVIVAIGMGVLGIIAYAESKKTNQTIKNLTSDHITVANKAVFGNYTGMDVNTIKSPDESSLSLPNNTVTTLVSTLSSAEFNTINLPTAKKSDRVVLVLGGDVGTDIKILYFQCASGNSYAAGTIAPSVATSDNTMKYIKSSGGETRMSYNVAGGDNNIMGKGSVIEFISDKDGEWQVYFNIVPESSGSTSTGTIEFS